MWITPLPPSLAALGEGSHGSILNGNYAPNRLSSAWKPTGEAWKRIRHLLLSKDYVTYRLTGRMVTDPAAAVSALLYDVQRASWSHELCALIDLPLEVLPEVLPIGAEVETVTVQAAELLGVSPKAVVFNGTMDSTAETFSAGVRSEHECVIRLASAGGIHAISRSANPHPKLISYPYPVAPYWLSQAGTATCAAAVNWAKSLFWSGQEEADFAAWSRLAEQSRPGANGVLFHPYLSGERCPYWDADLRGSFIGLGLHNNTGDMARAVYEGTAFSLRDALSVLDEQGFAPREITLVGGGAKSRLWCQTVANVFGFPVTMMPEADSSYGGALLALRAMGCVHNNGAVDNAAPRSWLEPNHKTRDFYDETFEVYRFAHERLADIYHVSRPKSDLL